MINMKIPDNIDKGSMLFVGILIAIALALFYIILGFSGMMSLLGITLIFMLPTYLILDNFELETDEKIVFSFFIGVGVFPSIAYWLGVLMPFRIAILATFIILLIAWLLIKKCLSKNKI